MNILTIITVYIIVCTLFVHGIEFLLAVYVVKNREAEIQSAWGILLAVIRVAVLVASYHVYMVSSIAFTYMFYLILTGIILFRTLRSGKTAYVRLISMLKETSKKNNWIRIRQMVNWHQEVLPDIFGNQHPPRDGNEGSRFQVTVGEIALEEFMKKVPDIPPDPRDM